MSVPKKVDIVIAGEPITGSVVRMNMSSDREAFSQEIINREFTVTIKITDDQHKKLLALLTEGDPA